MARVLSLGGSARTFFPVRHRPVRALGVNQGDTDDAFLYTGQTAGLISAIEPAAVVVERIVADATERLRDGQGKSGQVGP